MVLKLRAGCCKKKCDGIRVKGKDKSVRKGRDKCVS